MIVFVISLSLSRPDRILGRIALRMNDGIATRRPAAAYLFGVLVRCLGCDHPLLASCFPLLPAIALGMDCVVAVANVTLDSAPIPLLRLVTESTSHPESKGALTAQQRQARVAFAYFVETLRALGEAIRHAVDRATSTRGTSVEAASFNNLVALAALYHRAFPEPAMVAATEAVFNIHGVDRSVRLCSLCVSLCDAFRELHVSCATTLEAAAAEPVRATSDPMASTLSVKTVRTVRATLPCLCLTRFLCVASTSSTRQPVSCSFLSLAGFLRVP